MFNRQLGTDNILDIVWTYLHHLKFRMVVVVTGETWRKSNCEASGSTLDELTCGTAVRGVLEVEIGEWSYDTAAGGSGWLTSGSAGGRVNEAGFMTSFGKRTDKAPRPQSSRGNGPVPLPLVPVTFSLFSH